MKHIHNVFFQLFFVAIVFSCCGVYADDFSFTIIGGKPVISWLGDTTYSNYSNSTSGTKQQICPENQYVYGCGNYRIGFNWLKSATLTDPNPNAQPSTHTTKNYYISDDPMVLFKQMRNFFHGDAPSIKYNNNGNLADAPLNDYRKDREVILQNLCNPLTSATAITCATCPNGAKVHATTVQINDQDKKVVQNSWDFYTIADCYMDEFKDSTGTYVYVDDINNNNTRYECYYTNTNPNAITILNGDSTSDFVPGININTQATLNYVEVPTDTSFQITTY